MTDKLSLYNGALLLIGERKLASLTEAREPRRVLDTIYDDGFVEGVLEAATWNFATRSLAVDYSPSTEPPFGWRRAFVKPDDYVRTVAVCQDEYFRYPLEDYEDESGFWFAEQDTIYVRFTSSDDSYGGSLGNWTPSMVKYAKAELAYWAAVALTKAEDIQKAAEERRDKWLSEASTRDAIAEPMRRSPMGSWAAAWALAAQAGPHLVEVVVDGSRERRRPGLQPGAGLPARSSSRRPRTHPALGRDDEQLDAAQPGFDDAQARHRVPLLHL
jgi:hypothetical protein